MNLFTRIVCFALLVAGLILLAFGSNVHSQESRSFTGALAEAEKVSGDYFRFETKSPKGARILSAKRVSEPMARAIDRGLDDLFDAAREERKGYRKKMRHQDYVIFVGNADRIKNTKGEYSPDIAVGAAQYAGTKYDKGGYIFASGMVISPRANAFLIAEHTSDFERVARVVRYEGEHLVLYHNDRRRFTETMDHSKGGGHPIFQ